MGYYSDNVLPRILNKAMDAKVQRAARAACVRACAEKWWRSASGPG